MTKPASTPESIRAVVALESLLRQAKDVQRSLTNFSEEDLEGMAEAAVVAVMQDGAVMRMAENIRLELDRRRRNKAEP